MNIEVILVNSFTVNGQGGNPAGVVLNADKLTDMQKLKIAQAVGYSETAFVSSDDEADFEVSFFTTTDEVDFCGHANVSYFFYFVPKGHTYCWHLYSTHQSGHIICDDRT